MAVDAQGPDKVQPYLDLAGATFVTLIDEPNLLSSIFGFKAVPNGLLIDEYGILNYQKYGGGNSTIIHGAEDRSGLLKQELSKNGLLIKKPLREFLGVKQ